ncbi:MAG: ATP-binding cassette domain-containing protein [Lentisphaerae bacterium]|nr:ATP-binding cassette domain-containing protein [Lentisphaerota bacterium]
MIEATHLTKRYGRILALDNVTFRVQRGEIVGFLGPNGAGKTTTMRIISTYLPATGGTVRVCGVDVLDDPLAVRRHIGYMPENVPLYPEMRVREYLRYRGTLKGLRGRRLRARVEEAMAACDLGDVRRRVIGRLSKGYAQRVGLADALLHEPDVLIMDEPTLGLDPNQQRRVRDLIRSLARRHTVLLSSHILSEVEQTCERVLIIDKGRVVASDTPQRLVSFLRGEPHVRMEIQGPADAVVEKVMALPHVRNVACETKGGWQHLTCRCARGADVRPALFALAAAEQWTVRELRLEQSNLEDVFAELTSEQGGEGVASPDAAGREAAA